MNKLKQIIRHGEVLLKQIKGLPKGAELKEASRSYIVAHSETGHHHVLEATKDFKIYSTLDGETFIEIPSIAKLRHAKTGKDVHKTHVIEPSVYKVVIKKEFSYFSGLLQRVRD